MDGWVVGQMGRWVDDGGMDGCVANGWMNGWVDKWMMVDG